MTIVGETDPHSRAVFRQTVQKYVVLQIPGAFMILVLLVVFYYAGYISVGMAGLLFAGWCLKDAVMFRVLRKAYEPGPLHGTDALVGLRAIVVNEVAPEGSVRIGSEHWSARAADASRPLRCGSKVRVVAVDGFTVTVAVDNEETA